ncbi:MAG: DUF3990 domain-containing protein [Prevotellaceae bacterium]|jgi:hypothetical protein|nr:DUF3990 domain-containing protein [Prevotellaceae bacterium]
MTVYHGSTETVKKPTTITGGRFLDFGYGFYTTTNRPQALRQAEIKRKRTGKSDSSLNVYEIDGRIFADKSFAFLQFDNPNHEWLEFVINNRRGTDLHEYDFVQGPVANDTLYQTFILYESGVLTLEETIVRLKVHDLFDQISFHTGKALQELHFVSYSKINPDSL